MHIAAILAALAAGGVIWLLVGLAAGFFGIGGGFLIVPGLIMATAMPLPYAIGTSLVVSALGLTTTTSYALSGLVDWGVTALLVIGGVAGDRRRHRAWQKSWHPQGTARTGLCRHGHRSRCLCRHVISVRNALQRDGIVD
ncbi:TSUP family transporter [Sphingomonas dokdonensis]|uniref:Probable membrane transporter protein n=1 Tax=Sphingomonas dokdonensis TaxID=344880 RepID=A0A245ZMM6_9SPHN|nr:sulfite exporter TauE/SafE [Sphingomonas dokdonensis]